MKMMVQIILIFLDIAGLMTLFAYPLLSSIAPEIIEKYVMANRSMPRWQSLMATSLKILFFVSLYRILSHGSGSFLRWVPRNWGGYSEDGDWYSTFHVMRSSIGFLLTLFWILVIGKHWESAKKR